MTCNQIAVFAVALGALTQLGCGSSSTPGNGSKTSWVKCATEAECDSDERCVDGRCSLEHPPAQSTLDAPDASGAQASAAACDPLRLQVDGADSPYTLDHFARGIDDDVFLVLRTSDSQTEATLRVFFGVDPVRERRLYSATQNERGDTIVRFDLDATEATATLGAAYFEAPVTGASRVQYTPMTLQYEVDGVPRRRRFDELEPDAAALVERTFECLPGAAEPQLPEPPPVEAGPECRATQRTAFCVESEAATGDPQQGRAFALDVDLIVTALGSGTTPSANCPFVSPQRLGGGFSSDDIVATAQSSWLQGTDAEGITTTLSFNFPGFRLPVAIGDAIGLSVAVLDGGFSVGSQRLELRDADSELLAWFGVEQDAAALPWPTELSATRGAVACSGLNVCVGSWDLYGIDVTWNGVATAAEPDMATAVGPGWLLHSGQYAQTGPAPQPCTDAYLPGVTAAYWSDRGNVPNTEGIGGACQFPIGDPAAVRRGEPYCLGGLGYPVGYLTANCASNADCPGASTCDGQQCRAECTSDTQCPAPLSCTGPELDSGARSCRCGADCFAERCDVATCPDACPDPDSPGVSYFSRDAVACLDALGACEPGLMRFDLAGCGCGCLPIPLEQCPSVPETAEFRYAPGGCEPACDASELAIRTVCGCGCAAAPQCSHFDPLDEPGPDYLGAPGQCSERCDQNTTPVDDNCGCFCFWTDNLRALCDAPADTGPCLDTQQRYFRNVYSGVCEPFDYGGCLGNWNNFSTLQECQALCGM